jgi:hypothetical protein
LFAAGASAAVTSQTMSGNALPTSQSQTELGAVSANVTFDLGYDSMFTPNLTEVVVHFDNDFAFDPAGISECNLSTIATVPESSAKALCPTSQVGAGDLSINGGLLTGSIVAFNGVPSGATPTIGLHTDVFTAAHAYAFSLTLYGSLLPSSRGGDYGTALDFTYPPTGTTITHFNLTLQNQASSGHSYVSARCADSDRVWDYVTDFHFNSGGPSSAKATQGCQAAAVATSPAPATPQSTGQRDAQIKKCKKKYKGEAKAKKRKKCIKKANKLPV